MHQMIKNFEEAFSCLRAELELSSSMTREKDGEATVVNAEEDASFLWSGSV